eukprot:scaffold392_cov101-Isochrysis_galbana.AAC.16
MVPICLSGGAGGRFIRLSASSSFLAAPSSAEPLELVGVASRCLDTDERERANWAGSEAAGLAARVTVASGTSRSARTSKCPCTAVVCAGTITPSCRSLPSDVAASRPSAAQEVAAAMSDLETASRASSAREY